MNDGPIPSPPPVAPKPRRPALTRHQVVTAALAIIDSSGVDALSMRRLGQALNRNPMAIYRHAADKHALLDGVVEYVFSQIDVCEAPGPGPVQDWEDALRRTAYAFRNVALAHPNAMALVFTRQLAGPLARQPAGMLRPLEAMLEVLISAGFDEHGALHAARLFTGFLHGHVLNELQERIDNPNETDDLLRVGLHLLPLDEFPRLRALAGPLATYDGVAELNEGLAIVLAGLRGQLLGSREAGPEPSDPG